MIVQGKIAPGHKLKVEELREMLGLGASPIREALSLLTSDQLVDRFDNRGFRAAAADRANFEEILSLRCTLEGKALRESIANSSQDWEEDLVLAHHRMAKHSKDDPEEFENLHKEFHMALLAASPSPILLRFCNQLYDLNIRYRYLAGRSSGYQKRNIPAEHQGIMESAINGDAEAAVDRLTQHYRDTGAFLSELLARAEALKN